jgi:hypothetical protein
MESGSLPLVALFHDGTMTATVLLCFHDPFTVTRLTEIREPSSSQVTGALRRANGGANPLSILLLRFNRIFTLAKPPSNTVPVGFVQPTHSSRFDPKQLEEAVAWKRIPLD